MASPANASSPAGPQPVSWPCDRCGIEATEQTLFSVHPHRFWSNLISSVVVGPYQHVAPWRSEERLGKETATSSVPQVRTCLDKVFYSNFTFKQPLKKTINPRFSDIVCKERRTEGRFCCHIHIITSHHAFAPG